MRRPRRSRGAAAVAAHDGDLMRRDGVVAVAVGIRTVGGRPTGERCLKVYVRKKLPLSRLRDGELLPRALPVDSGEVRVDVEEAGGAVGPAAQTDEPAAEEAAALRTTARPAFAGVSIAHYQAPVGTLTAGVIDLLSPGTTGVLGCNHVLGQLGLASYGDAILQPSLEDDGMFPASTLAFFARASRLFFGPAVWNRLDAAIGYAAPGSVLIGTSGLGILRGVREMDDFELGEAVWKLGRTTGLTAGRVVGLCASVEVDYGSVGHPGRVSWFRNQLLTTEMSAYGDSGALLLDATGGALGMLFCSSPAFTAYNPLASVEDMLGVRVAARIPRASEKRGDDIDLKEAEDGTPEQP
jgi:hypothetical protein